MKHKNGILRSIFGESWGIETNKNDFTYQGQEYRGSLSYLDIKEVKIAEGLISDGVIIKHKSGQLTFGDFSSTGAEKLSTDILQKTKKCLAEHLSNHSEELETLNMEMEVFLSENRYIAQSDIRRWLSLFPVVGEYISHPYFDTQLLNNNIQENFSLLSDIRKPSSTTLRGRNESFIEHAIRGYSKFFNKLEKFPLSEEQKRAAVTDEDRNLLIAAAGSGKTSTIIAKAFYLVESRLAKPNEILILAYNKDAQLEIKERLKNAFLKINGRKKIPASKTFHGYGLEIIGEATGQKPRIAAIAQANDKTLKSMFSKLISELATKNNSFYADWLQYITTAKQPLPDSEKIKTKADYERFLEQMGAERKGNKNASKTLKFTTIDNREVKSLQELRLFNWLVINGVDFVYERRYEFPTANRSHSQYHPDFYYPEANLYHEHFALDQNGLPPKFMENYLEGVYWKRSIHRENGTKLIETHSAHFYQLDVFKDLKEKLKSFGVTFRPLKKDALDRLIAKSFDITHDANIFITFLKHFKSNNFTFTELKERFSTSSDRYRSTLFLSLFEAIYEEYQSRLNNAQEIDFEDQINWAAGHLEERDVEHNWKYVLVDEFQDISQDRKRLLDAILSQSDYIKLFAVGDDWQSIYRFAGADVDIITNFKSHFGATAQNQLTKTFRSYQGLIDVASNFIQQNPVQLKKSVSSSKNNITAAQVIIKEYSDQEDQKAQLHKILHGIKKIGTAKKSDLSVFVLARYSHQLPRDQKYIKKHFPSLSIDFKTIHASKGLEADYVILLNLSNEKYGFPSLIEDDPLIKLVIPKVDDFPHSEERRLLYVAITRAMRGSFLLSRKGRQSDFITELIDLEGVQAPDELKYQTKLANVENLYCPKCNEGKLKIRTDKAGKYEPFLGCSNYPRCRLIQRPVQCPQCKSGHVVKRSNSKTKNTFYPCNNFKCSFILKT